MDIRQAEAPERQLATGRGITAMNLLIFDCDGTLVDSQHMIVASMEAAFDAAGLARPEPARVRGVIGLSLEEAVARLLAPADRHRAAALAEDYKGAFRALREIEAHREPLFPGVRETIAVLSARDDVALAIATGKSRRGVAAVLEREGWTRTFSSIQTADDHPSKPDPSMIIRAMLETGAERASTLMIGDTTYDIEMAVNAGVRGLGVGWGYHAPEELAAAGAHAVVQESRDLAATLTRLMHESETAA
jgi:phosphoglycolate phosphatase